MQTGKGAVMFVERQRLDVKELEIGAEYIEKLIVRRAAAFFFAFENHNLGAWRERPVRRAACQGLVTPAALHGLSRDAKHSIAGHVTHHERDFSAINRRPGFMSGRNLRTHWVCGTANRQVDWL